MPKKTSKTDDDNKNTNKSGVRFTENKPKSSSKTTTMLPQKKIKRPKGTGRKKIAIEYIKEKTKRSVCFSKRKGGLIKKAYELTALTGAHMLVLIYFNGSQYRLTTEDFDPVYDSDKFQDLLKVFVKKIEEKKKEKEKEEEKEEEEEEEEQIEEPSEDTDDEEEPVNKNTTQLLK